MNDYLTKQHRIKECVQAHFDRRRGITKFWYVRYEGYGNKVDALKWPMVREHEWTEKGNKRHYPLRVGWKRADDNQHLSNLTYCRWS